MEGKYSRVPIIEDCIAWIDCLIGDVHEAGDHYIAVEVHGIGASEKDDGLLFLGGSYGSFNEDIGGMMPIYAQVT